MPLQRMVVVVVVEVVRCLRMIAPGATIHHSMHPTSTRCSERSIRPSCSATRSPCSRPGSWRSVSRSATSWRSEWLCPVCSVTCSGWPKCTTCTRSGISCLCRQWPGCFRRPAGPVS
uniref:Putative secreted protein n=1 Tax=Anopheles darlingi TaxID=43151 RepID=A0A2M4D5A8_ANODA